MDDAPINRTHLIQLRAVFEAGFNACAVECGLLKPYLSLNQAQKKYGRKTVNRWIDEGLIKVIKDGTGTSKKRIDRKEIEMVAATSNRASWYEHRED